MFCAALMHVGWSQDLYVSATGSVTVSAGEALYVNGNLEVASGGTLTIQSDRTATTGKGSGSLMFNGTTATGDITYEVHFPDANEWYFISVPVTSQGVQEFTDDAANDIRLNGNTYAIGVYDNTNNPAISSRWDYHDPTSPDPLPQNRVDLTEVNSGNFVNGRGYNMSRNTGGSVSFTGGMPTNDVTMNLDWNPDAKDHNWFNMGNPFPAFLPVNNAAVVTDNLLTDNINEFDPAFGALYFFFVGTNQWNPINNLSAAQYIPPGQGFLVKMKRENRTFTFSNNYRTHQPVTGGDHVRRGATTDIPEVVVYLSVFYDKNK